MEVIASLTASKVVKESIVPIYISNIPLAYISNRIEVVSGHFLGVAVFSLNKYTLHFPSWL